MPVSFYDYRIPGRCLLSSLFFQSHTSIPSKRDPTSQEKKEQASRQKETNGKGIEDEPDRG